MSDPARPTVLVTGTGGGVGQSVMKALAGGPYRVVACDGEPHAAGLFAAERGQVIPYARDPAFLDRLLDVGLLEGARLIFPGLDAELAPLAGAAGRFRAAGIVPIVSRPQVVDIADDKLATSRFLEENGLPAPHTEAIEPGATLTLSPPLVLKPRLGGARSRGVHLVRDERALAHRLAELEESGSSANYIAQQFLDGPEYTCGVVSLEGECFGPIVMRRVLRDGDTHKAYVTHAGVIDDAVRAAALALDPFGACNFQLRLVEGTPYIFEINARCSGTTAARALAGFNEPRMVADFLCFGERPTFAIHELAILRYWQELAVPMTRIDEMDRVLRVEGDGGAL